MEIEGGALYMSFSQLNTIQLALNEKFYDRQQEIEALMTALLAKQHLLLIGPAGTGKSALSAMLGEIFEDSHYFQHLLTPFSTPEELFGALSLKDLEQGVYKRNIQGMLPEAHFAFIDEIFKANSAILNSLLTLINERLYYNNGVPIASPLMTLIGSSNEYIEEDEGLEALFDRFLLRYEVQYIRKQEDFVAMLKSTHPVFIPKLTLQQLQEHQQRVSRVRIEDSMYMTLAKIRQALFDEGIRPSDRRFKQSLSLLQARAYLQNRLHVTKDDMAILQHVLWERVEQKARTREIIEEISFDSVEDFIGRIQPEFDMLLLQAQNLLILRSPQARTQLSDLLMRGKALFLEVQTMNREVPNRSELLHLKNDMHKRLLQMTSDVIGF